MNTDHTVLLYGLCSLTVRSTRGSICSDVHSMRIGIHFGNVRFRFRFTAKLRGQDKDLYMKRQGGTKFHVIRVDKDTCNPCKAVFRTYNFTKLVWSW